MQRKQFLKMSFRTMVFLITLATTSEAALSQAHGIIVNMSMLEGIEVSPANVYNFQVFNNGGRAREAEIKGTLRYRNSPLRFTYTFNTVLQPGLNNYSNDNVHNPAWSFSDNALRELFFTYGKLPQGTYEYCIELRLKEIQSEQELGEPVNACVYYTVNDIFLINLVEPEDDAKLYEQYPMFSWMVNYPFASELTYRIRIAELKQGQNNENAIARNNPVYKDNNVFATGMTYPVFAKPLQNFQPYVWTVDAYYKGILLGGAEAWKFTIIEDTLLKEVFKEQSYYEFENHIGDTRLDITGLIKLKYRADGSGDTLFLKVVDKKGKEKKFKENIVPLHNGYNWLDIMFHEKASLQHGAEYDLQIINKAQKTYTVPFTYNNPLFTR